MREVDNTRTEKLTGAPAEARARAYFAALRPRQWAKNLLVLAPLVFSQKLFAREPAAAALTAFALFCLASSAGYLFNDIGDLRQDREHPRKRLRPVASGRWRGGAAVLAAFCSPTSRRSRRHSCPFSLARVLLRAQPSTPPAQARGIVVRVRRLAGACCSRRRRPRRGRETSGWLLICTRSLRCSSLRQATLGVLLLKTSAGGHRRVLEDYDERLLDMLIGTSAASAVMSYALYTESAETVGRLGTRWLFATFPFVVYGLFRYLYLLYRAGRGGDPVETALGDAHALNALLWRDRHHRLYFR